MRLSMIWRILEVKDGDITLWDLHNSLHHRKAESNNINNIIILTKV